MKRLSIFFLSLLLVSCNKLDLNPLSESSSENFYSSQAELEMAVNDLYRLVFWGNDDEAYSDNHWQRSAGGNEITYGTMDAGSGIASTLWVNCYKPIARANTFLANKDRAKNNTPETVLLRLEAEARLIRAYQYSRLITHFGDVPLLKVPVSLEESYKMTRTSREEILTFLLAEFDWAAAQLPASYGSGELKRLTKGAALALKARTALYLGKWAEARDAAKAVIDLGAYQLHNSYTDLFLVSGETSKEIIISIPRSQELSVFIDAGTVRDYISRNAGGYGAQIPTWSLVDSYECTDGLPVDQSPLYNPKKPFANRDPRMTMSIVEFGTPWLGFSYQPHPDSTQTFSYKTGKKVSNLDCRAVNTFASYTGFIWKKGIDQTWADRLAADNDVILCRYAEMLLTYAEAKTELGEIDASALNALNQVRARAYGVAVTATGSYPAVKTTDAAALRTVIKRERRVEFAREGLRYMDLVRWKLAEKALTRPIVGMQDPNLLDRGKWPFAGAPAIDADGIPDYSALMGNIKSLAVTNFDKNRQYLWPIPANERRVNPNLTQNSGY